MRRLATAVLLASTLAAVLLPAPAAAVTVLPQINPWRMVSERSGANLDEASAVRAADGRLHVVYTDDMGVSSQGIRYRTLSAGGAWSTPETVVSGWVSINNPDIELIGGVPHVFWAGQSSADVSDPASSGQAWYASRAGGTWTRSAAPFSNLSTAYASSQFSTALTADEVPWGAWTGTFGLRIHSGLATGAAEPSLSGGCCDYAANLGRDAATGDIYAVYYSNADEGEGYFTQRVSPSIGDRVLLPVGRYAGQALSRDKRLAAASRTTGGVFSAYCDRYPSCTGVRVGDVSGTTLRLRLPSAINAETVWTAAAPQGRLWLSWADSRGVWATRSNKALTRWGALQLLKGPRNFDSAWQTGGEASRGTYDLLANFDVNGDFRTWHVRVRPKLSVVAPKVTHSDMTRFLVLRLVDAGDPVVGTIRFRGVSKTTNALGVAVFTVPKGTPTGRYPATGSATGFIPGLTRVYVHRM